MGILLGDGAKRRQVCCALICLDGIAAVGLVEQAGGQQDLFAGLGNLPARIIETARLLGVANRLGLLAHRRQRFHTPAPIVPPLEPRLVDQRQQLVITTGN